jgi:hypothetical protein
MADTVALPPSGDFATTVDVGDTMWDRAHGAPQISKWCAAWWCACRDCVRANVREHVRISCHAGDGRLLFVGTTEEEKQNARALERDFWGVVQRETRVTRLVAMAACVVMLAVGYIAWPCALYLGSTVGAVAAFVLLLMFPRKANILMATFVLPAGAGAFVGRAAASLERCAMTHCVARSYCGLLRGHKPARWHARGWHAHHDGSLGNSFHHALAATYRLRALRHGAHRGRSRSAQRGHGHAAADVA